MEESCAACAQFLSKIIPDYDEKTEKTKISQRHLDCCGRIICGNCIQSNSRFASYCLFCQISTIPSPLPQGLREPPSYATVSSSKPFPPLEGPPAYVADGPTSYSSGERISSTKLPEKSSGSRSAEDVLHFLDHRIDTLSNLSLRYNVPISALRRSNNITSDLLLPARKAVIIPSDFYKGGVSLNPRPVEGEEEEHRKVILRRWMVACKVSQYDIGLLYLEQFDYHLEQAIQAYRDDEKWEKGHPIERVSKSMGKKQYDRGKRIVIGSHSLHCT